MQCSHRGGLEIQLYSFLTPVLHGGGWLTPSRERFIPPRERAPVAIVQEAGWVPEPVWTGAGKRKYLACNGVRTPNPLACNGSLYLFYRMNIYNIPLLIIYLE